MDAATMEVIASWGGGAADAGAVPVAVGASAEAAGNGGGEGDLRALLHSGDIWTVR